MRRYLRFTTLVAGSLTILLATAGLAEGRSGGQPRSVDLTAATRVRSTRPAVATPVDFPRGGERPPTPTTAPPPPPPTTAPPTTVPPTTAPPATDPPTTAPPAPAPHSGGGLVCPVDGPSHFTDTWGAPRAGHTHVGVDMLAAYGTPTVAPVSGTVEHRTVSGGGLTWFLNGDDGTTYVGMHLSSYAHSGGGWVPAGTVIGYVGDSGNAEGTPHLHFEVHPGGGAPVDPYPYAAEAC